MSLRKASKPQSNLGGYDYEICDKIFRKIFYFLNLVMKAQMSR